jgi:GDP-L-fucose synthase
MISHINVGTGKDYTIKELAETIAKVVGYLGDLKLDDSKPDGSPRKLMDISLLRRLGWESKGSLEEGLKQTYEWFLANQNNFRK